jgi:hypothetical protein
MLASRPRDDGVRGQAPTLSLDQVDMIHGHTARIRSFAALLLSVLQAEHVIGRAALGDGLAELLVGIEADTLAIDAVLAPDA